MKYYFDTEFLEGTQKEKFPINLFRKNTSPTIDLISIGIVAEDGREFYAISKDFNLKEAWNRFDRAEQTIFEKQNGFKGRKIFWIRENVLKPIWIDLFLLYESEFTFLKGKAYDSFEKELKEGKHDKYFTLKSLTALIKRYGKTNIEIAEKVKEFCHFWKTLDSGRTLQNHPIEFYAYYADYDWVVFCWLFGKMMDLPNGFPMYCKDLKQMLDEKESVLKNNEGKIEIKGSYVESVGAFECFNFNSLKNIPNYPKQENEHNALADARWNKKLHEFLANL